MSLGSSRRFTLAPTILLTGMALSQILEFSLLDFRVGAKFYCCSALGGAYRLVRQFFCRILNRIHDMLITRAATDIAVKGVANLLLRWLRMAHKKLVRGQNHPRSTVAALQPVTFPESFLERMEILSLGQPLDGQKIGAIGLDGKNGTGLHRGIVQHDGTGAADARLASDMRAR